MENEKEKIKDIFDAPKKDFPKQQNKGKEQSRKVKIILILKNRVVVEDGSGNGISVVFTPERRAKLNVGDTIDI